MIKVGVVGYGTIGQRLADGVARQGDMELVGVADVALTLAVRALKEKGMPYRFFCALPEARAGLEDQGLAVSGTLADLIDQCDVLLDSSPGGIGAKNKAAYQAAGKKAIFQGGEADDVADVFFHGYANYEIGVGQQFLKLTSCNTTGLIRAVDCLDRVAGVSRAAITIIRRVADPGDYHRGLTNALQIDPAPTHQAVDLMKIMPHVDATGILVHTPVTHGHILTALVSTKQGLDPATALAAFRAHPRIRVVRIKDGFMGNASLFKYARDLGHPRGDMYEVAIWEESIVQSGADLMFAINIPQESVTIPETIDAIRAATGMQTDRLAGVAETNRYLDLVAGR